MIKDGIEVTDTEIKLTEMGVDFSQNVAMFTYMIHHTNQTEKD